MESAEIGPRLRRGLPVTGKGQRGKVGIGILSFMELRLVGLPSVSLKRNFGLLLSGNFVQKSTIKF
jgi:hypothetical protein